ncbi:uracil phosphoribosyltransferase [Archangium violaceum]|uniref:uracil phosphoribosyltransferase n=1 Tax=Archangium violaceum TaxID=83451 RepID=UPI00193AE5AC|nr:uracil phosphoribosyltransferase [Archangium violaceum]QRK04326.1 uracil phosphoribosyltransferase [Archangium violaceum]
MSDTTTTPSIQEYLGKNVHLLPQTKQLRALHTIIRDRTARREDIVFYSRRIFRQLLEAGLNFLPFESWEVETPVGRKYDGLRFAPQICGVSVIRAGESMEAELREICRSIRIGKILIQRDKITKLPRLYYSSLPNDIARRHILLMDPMLATGGSALAAIQVLLERGVPEENIVFINLLTVPEGITALCRRHPKVKLVTSSIEERLNENAYMLPGIGDFGDRFFGTDT